MSGRGPDSGTDHNRNSIGSGGSPGSGSGAGGGSDADDCLFVQTAPLSSPVPAVVSGLKVGDVLEVDLQNSPSGNRLLVSTAGGQAAGSLTHPGHLKIIQCIGTGHIYKATVVQKTGALIALRIEPK